MKERTSGEWDTLVKGAGSFFDAWDSLKDAIKKAEG
jgi:hypothetical protein